MRSPSISTSWTRPSRWRAGCSGAGSSGSWPSDGNQWRRYRTRVRLATWNVNSVKQRVPRLLPWLDERQPDIACLQETKLADEAFEELLGDELARRDYVV